MSAAPSDNANNNPNGALLEQRPHRRRRAILVCDVCRAKKNRCDGARPVCGACQRRQSVCLYAGQKPHISDAQRWGQTTCPLHDNFNRHAEQALSLDISTVSRPETIC
jgi:hypothetical protein